MAKKEVKAKDPTQVVVEIQQLCELLGWNIAMNEQDDGVAGLIIGLEPWVKDILEDLPNKSDFGFYGATDNMVEKGIH